MKFFSIFGSLNIKISDSFLKKVADMIGLYFFIWLIIEIIFWLFLGALDLLVWMMYEVNFFIDLVFGTTPPSFTGFINLKPFMNGFTLFMYFPNWLRIILMTYISVAVISIPITIFAYIYFSNEYSGIEDTLREDLKIRCIECKNKLGVPGEWLNGETDIRCGKCGALMTLTLENGRFKRLILKQPTKYSQDYLSLL